jgi:uncharacterized protein (TIGR02722 family)
MMKKISVTRFILFFAFVFFTFGMISGCTVTTRTVSSDEELHYDESYDFSDKKTIVDALVKPLLASAPIPQTSEKPIIVVYDVANRTSEHISTQSITDDIREALLKSGKFRFVNRLQRDNIANELDYQHGGDVAPGNRVQPGQQTGADYILSGTLYSIEKKEPRQVRLKKKELKYYKLNLELTNIKSSELVWTDSVEVIREASKPFIGW